MEHAELQTDVIEDVLETVDDLNETEDGAESAPAKAPDGFIPVDKHQKDVNKQHFKYREEERARKKLEAEAAELRKQLEEIKAKEVDISIPPIPDPYDENFEEKVRERDTAIERAAQHKANLTRIENEQKENEELSLAQQQEALGKKVEGFDKNMVALGLIPAEVKAAADTLVDYGISDTLQDVILEHEEGPLIAKYLAQNPVELEQLESMSTLQLVNHIATAVQPKASLLRPQTSQAPAPTVDLGGGGVEELEDPELKGATFE